MIFLSKNLLQFLAFVVRIIYSYNIYVCTKKIFNWLHSYWLHPIFKSCHKTVFFGKIGRIHGSKCITIAEKTRFGDFFYLDAWPEFVKNEPILKIGSNCNFGAFGHITCTNKIIIGNNVLTGKWVTISDNNHGNTSKYTLLLPPYKREIVSKGAVVVEDNVWIGDKATILSGVHIGKGSVIAANAVVTKNIPAYSIAAGNPARIINNKQE